MCDLDEGSFVDSMNILTLHAIICEQSLISFLVVDPLSPSSFQKEFVPPPPLLLRKMSNPDLSPAATAATKSKLHRQLSQDESWGRRSSLAMTGNRTISLHVSEIKMSCSVLKHFMVRDVNDILQILTK